MADLADEMDDSGPRIGGPLVMGAQSSDPELREPTRALLEAQKALTDLQIEELRREDRVRHWSLRVHHVSEILKVASMLAVAFIVVAATIGLGTALWSAEHDTSLVIQPFSVPPDLAARGLTGQVLANQLLDKLNAMEQQTAVFGPLGDYRSEQSEEIKVQIPETGVSFGEFYGYLARRFGHQTIISGDVYHTQSGLNVTIRSGTSAQTFAAPDAGLEALMGSAAETVMKKTRPDVYLYYLNTVNRFEEARDLAESLTDSPSAFLRVRSFAGLATALLDLGDFRGAIAAARRAIALDPGHSVNADNILVASEADISDDGDARRDAQDVLAGYRVGRSSELTPAQAAFKLVFFTQLLDEETGDYADAVRQILSARALEVPAIFKSTFAPDAAVDAAHNHDVDGSRALMATTPFRSDADATSLGAVSVYPPLPNFFQSVEREDWKNALSEIERADAIAAKPDSGGNGLHATFYAPWIAWALARAGDASGARRVIEGTPLDCYLCVRMRGRIDRASGNLGGAAYWFEAAIRQAPSIPFAYADWGDMMMARGDFDGAIRKFGAASTRGPHFADPREKWGETLILMNRSDLALSKFEEANSFAPNWGRLHLKWGEALMYLGRTGEARAQFGTAARLTLSEADRAELARHLH